MSAAIPAIPAALRFAIEILKWLPAAKAGVAGAIEALDWGHERLTRMVEENRDPNEEEWHALNTRTADLRRALHED